MFLSILTFAIWTSVFVINKVTLSLSTPVFLNGVRMVLAGFLVGVYLFFKRKKYFKMTKNDILPIILLAILGLYLANILELWGLQYLSSAKTCLIYSLTPFFSAILSYVHFKEKFNFKKTIGLIIGFLGVLPVIYIKTDIEDVAGGFSFFSLAELSIIGAVFFSSYGWVILRLLVKNDKLSPLTVNCVAMLIAGFLSLIHSYFIDSWNPIPVQPLQFFPFLRGVFLITFVSNILCYNLYGYLLKRYTATFLSFIGLLSPIFASLHGWLFIGEKLSFVIFISTIVIIFGLFIVYQEELKQGYIKKRVIN
ncbi:MAG: hypothetical protein AMS24_02660 [Chlamydiae bacterium SM23_39]|nr:MAG: hypothetical protein AMS24_02660 [Chlamydiae bacterium SM23_39]